MSFKKVEESVDNYQITAVINGVSIVMVPQAKVLELQEKLDEAKDELVALNSERLRAVSCINFLKSYLNGLNRSNK